MILEWNKMKNRNSDAFAILLLSTGRPYCFRISMGLPILFKQTLPLTNQISSTVKCQGMKRPTDVWAFRHIF